MTTLKQIAKGAETERTLEVEFEGGSKVPVRLRRPSYSAAAEYGKTMRQSNFADPSMADSMEHAIGCVKLCHDPDKGQGDLTDEEWATLIQLSGGVVNNPLVDEAQRMVMRALGVNRGKAEPEDAVPLP